VSFAYRAQPARRLSSTCSRGIDYFSIASRCIENWAEKSNPYENLKATRNCEKYRVQGAFDAVDIMVAPPVHLSIEPGKIYMNVNSLSHAVPSSTSATVSTTGTHSSNSTSSGAKSATAAATPPTPATTQPSSTVSISNVARAALAEATESAATTAKEASGGDRQAQRLLAKQAAQKIG
jgi:hypothetical protein